MRFNNKQLAMLILVFGLAFIISQPNYHPPPPPPGFNVTFNLTNFTWPPIGGGIGPDPGNLITYSSANIQRVWAIDEGERIFQEKLDYPFPTSPQNAVWNGNRVSVFGGKNEMVAFQLILESSAAGASSVDVEFTSLTNGQYTIQNSPISAGDPYDYRGKRIFLFKQLYIPVTARSPSGATWWGGSMPLPNSDYLGQTPDALLPFEAAQDKGGAPFSIAARKNQGVWIDLYIPKDAPPGLYTGKMKVKVGGTVTHEVPIQLRVYNFEIPDETHLDNWWFGAGSGEEGLGVKHRTQFSLNNAAYKELEGRYFQMAHAHRMDLTFNANLGQMDHYKRYLTGEYYSYANKYDGPGVGAGHTMYSIGTYDQSTNADRTGRVSGFRPDTEAGWRAASDAWVSWFTQNAPNVKYFKYMHDEPDNSEATVLQKYALIANRSSWVKNNPGVGRTLKIFDTVKLDNRLYNSVDIFSTSGQSGYIENNIRYDGNPGGYNLPRANEWRSQGKEIGIYNGNRPAFGAGVMFIDTPGAEGRATPWVVWKYGVDFYFQWQTTIWNYYNHNTRNIFTTPKYNADNTGGNGNGYMFYPGEQRDFAGTEYDKGLAGPIASFRMKVWRRGVQDYEYLWLAKQRGLNTNAIVNSAVPCAFNDYSCPNYTSPRSQPTYYQRGYQYEDARRQLAELLGG